MKKATLLTLMLAGTALSATVADAAGNYRQRDRAYPYAQESRTSFKFNTGIRLNEFDWNIASDLSGEETPNILSELTWENVQTWEAKGNIRHLQPASYGPFRGSLLFDAELTGGLTFSGDNQDSDYLGDNRSGEFSRSNNDSSKGYVIAGELAAGYQFNLIQDIDAGSYTFFTLAPIGGYGWHRQQYRITEGNQTIPPTGRFTGLDSEYNATWKGPFIGMEARLEHNRHMLTLFGERHFLDYDADAVWNLRGDFQQDPSFEHEADDAEGIEAGLEYSYAIGPKYDFTFDYIYTKREAEDGLDKLYFSDGTTSLQRLNEVNDTSHAFRAGVRRTW